MARGKRKEGMFEGRAKNTYGVYVVSVRDEDDSHGRLVLGNVNQHAGNV